MSRDRTVGDTFYIAFTTRAFATGIPTVLAGSPIISAYEDAGLTQITAGLTLGVDHDSVAGMNMVTVVATGANGFESGKDYQLVITTGTVGGVSVVGEVIGQFSLNLSAAAKDLANGTDGLGALKTDSAAILVDTGTTLDGKINTIDTNVDSILVDTAEIGTAGVGLSDITLNAASIDLVWDEVLTGGTHNVNNSAGRRLRAVSGIILTDGTAQSGGNNTIQLASGDISTNEQFARSKVIITGGLGIGQEAIITSSAASTDTLTITPAWLINPDNTSDYQVIPAQTHSTVRNGGYDNASVYVDTINGSAGTQKGVNGTTTNPSSNLTDAYVIAAQENLTRFDIAPGSSVTLPAASSSLQITGMKYSLALNSADINGTTFTGSLAVTGIGDCATSAATFFSCGIGDVTLDPCNGFQCGFFGTFTMRSVGVYVFGGSAALTAPGLGMTIDFGSGLNASSWAMQSWGGGTIEVKNMGAGTGTYNMEASGWGHVIINANCSATSNVDLHGSFELTNNASGITIAQDSNYAETVLVDAVWDETLSGHATSSTFGKAIADTETDATAILADTAEIGTAGVGLTNIGTIATVTDVTNQVTANVTAISGDSTAADSLEASLETLVTGTATGTPTTTTMADSALTETTDDHFIGRVIIWRTGLLKQQATVITDYDGGTRLLTFTATTDAASSGDAYVIV